MNLDDTRRIAQQLLDEHGLTGDGWTFRFDRKKTRMGGCDWASKTVTLSELYAHSASEPHVRNILIHEVAHALVSPFVPTLRGGMKTDKHSRAWVQKCVELGGDGNPNPLTPEQAAGLGQPAYNLRPFGGIHPTAGLGETVVSVSGRQGTITGIGRTRYTVNTAEGEFTFAFESTHYPPAV